MSSSHTDIIEESDITEKPDIIKERSERKQHDFKVSSCSIESIKEVTDQKQMMKLFCRHRSPTDFGRIIKVTHSTSHHTGIVVLSAAFTKVTWDKQRIHALIYAGLSSMSYGHSYKTNFDIQHCQLPITKQFFVDPKSDFKGMYLFVEKTNSQILLSFRFRSSCSYIQSGSLAGIFVPFDEKEVTIDEKYYNPATIKIDPRLLSPATSKVQSAIKAWDAINKKFIAAHTRSFEAYHKQLS